MGIKATMAACAAAVACAWAGQAGAAVYTVTFAGVVTSGADSGDPFTATFTIDTSLAGSLITPGAVSVWGEAGLSSPITSAELTIGGQATSLFGGPNDFAILRDQYAPANPGFIEKFDSVSLAGADTFALNFWSDHSPGGGFDQGSFTDGSASGDLLAESASVSPAIAGAPFTTVPEPSAWALMIVGLGLIGATLRRLHGKSRNSCPALPR